MYLYRYTITIILIYNIPEYSSGFYHLCYEWCELSENYIFLFHFVIKKYSCTDKETC